MLAYLLRNLQPAVKEQVRSLILSDNNEFTEESLTVLLEDYLVKKGPTSLLELRLVDVKVSDQKSIFNLLTNVLQDIRLQTLALSKVRLEDRNVSLLCKIIDAGMPCLKNIDISWNKISTRLMKELFVALRPSQYIRNLNVAFNPVSSTDKLKELGMFIKQNTSLHHLDLSGVLQTAAQVQRVVKKTKRSQSLLALHLSHTMCIKMDIALQLYIQKKLQIVNKISGAHQIQRDRVMKYQNYTDPDEIAQKVTWKYKYELVQRAKIQQREAHYFQKQ